jgi:DNA helicase-2/ATP-dependent DNA helicase PcrA
LILAHTHAAVDTFASPTRDADRRVDIRTIDSLIAEIAGAYHLAIDLPADITFWIQAQKDGHHQLALKVAALLRSFPMIARSLAIRYPIVIFDEHQDASSEQHEIAMACLSAGAYVRIFGDPMQRIFGGKKAVEIELDKARWECLTVDANVFDKLDEQRGLRKFGQCGKW